MIPITIIGSGDIIKKGSAVITPGSVRIIISPLVEPRANKKENEEVLESIRNTIITTQHNQRGARPNEQ
jgi:1-acyl-sn-glycerol-3-phosphate acyltransferase